MGKALNEFFRQEANKRVLKQGFLYRAYLIAIKMTDEKREGKRWKKNQEWTLQSWKD